MATPIILEYDADVSKLTAKLDDIKAKNLEAAAQAKVLAEQRIRIIDELQSKEESGIRDMLKLRETANAQTKEQLDQQLKTSASNVASLEKEKLALKEVTTSTDKQTVAQVQLEKVSKRLQATLRGVAVTAAIAFGAAALKAVIDLVKGLFQASAATQAISAAMAEFTTQAGKALGNMREQFTELKKLTPGTLAWKNEIAKVNKQYGDMIKLDIDSTLADIEAAERLLTVALREQIREQVRRDTLAKAFADAEGIRLNVQLAKQQGVTGVVLDALEDMADQAEETATSIEKALEPKAWERFFAQQRAQGQELRDQQSRLTDLAGKEADKVNADRKAKGEQVAKEIAANFTQAEKLIQSLLDDLVLIQIDQLTDERARWEGQVNFKAELEVRSAKETIKNAEQLSTALILIESKRQQDLGIKSLDEIEASDDAIINERKVTDDEVFKNAKTIQELLAEGEKEFGEVRKKANKDFEKDLEEGMQRTVSNIRKVGGELGNLGNAFTQLSELVGEQTEAGAELAKVAALFSIAASEAIAIADVVAMAGEVAKSSGPAAPIAFAVTLAAGLAITVANILAAKKVIEGAEMPKFAEGEVNIKGKGGPKDDRILARISRGESVINAEGTAKHEDLLRAVNADTLNQYLNRNYILPAMLQGMKLSREADHKAMERTVLQYLESFDDARLHGDLQSTNKFLREISYKLTPAQKPAPRTRI